MKNTYNIFINFHKFSSQNYLFSYIFLNTLLLPLYLSKIYLYFKLIIYSLSSIYILCTFLANNSYIRVILFFPSSKADKILSRASIICFY